MATACHRSPAGQALDLLVGRCDSSQLWSVGPRHLGRPAGAEGSVVCAPSVLRAGVLSVLSCRVRLTGGLRKWAPRLLGLVSGRLIYF